MSSGGDVGWTPAFAVRTVDGSFRAYRSRSIADGYVKARVRNHTADVFELTLTPRTALREVWFPWQPEPAFLNEAEADDVFYFPHRMGVIEKASAVPPDAWRGETYPGGAFAPLVVMADERAATMAAAVNWPPRAVRPVYARGRIGLRYDDAPAVSERRTYAAMLVRVRGDERSGVFPWHLVLDRYKAWLLDRLQASGLWPSHYPVAMQRAHGWLHVDLQGLPTFRIREIEKLYAARRRVFPWLQFWGQMSNYQRSPAEGLTGWPKPPLRLFERVGCCLDQPVMHPRYRDSLPAFARRVASRGGIVGYYARPRSPYAPMDAPGSPDLLFLKGWTETNRRDGANAFYLDVLGARPFGAPLAMAHLLSSALPHMSVIEWPVDVYPTAFLIGGSLWGGPEWNTFPGQQLDAFHTRMTFPRFGRYLLDDRVILLGSSNGDFMWWGDYRGWAHWTERQVFLLGAKFDAPTRFKGQKGWIDPLNPTVKRIVAERERTAWWDRAPVYRDRAGIADVPEGVDVRRFVDRDGVDLFVVDNPERRGGTAFRFGELRVVVPRRALSILVVDGGRGRW